MKTLRKFAIPILLGMFLLILAACGGDDDSGTSSKSTSTGTTTTTTTSTSSGETTATSEGLSFKFQYACINRTLDPCELLAAPGGMVERIFERTNGQVEIEISSFPELGLAGSDTLRLVEDGTLGMVEIYSGYIGGDLPIVDVANLWGVIGDIATNWKTIEAVQGPIHKIIEERSNGVVLGESYYGNNYYYAGKALRSPADLKGMKIRSHSTVLGDLINGMGGDAQFVAFSEVYTALERGILDAAVTCGPCGAGLRWFEVADYLNGPIISIGVTYITVNKDRWDEIPADLQAIMKEEAMAHQAENRRLVEDVWDPLGITENVAGGMEFVEFSQELKDALKQASIDVVIPNWVDRNGGPGSEAVTMFNDLVGPIVGVTIDSNGKASETSRTTAPSSGGTTGESFEIQYVCVNRTLLPCKVIQEFMDAVRAETDGQVDIQLTSYPELGISGFDMIRLLEDGTIGMGEIYSGFVGGEFPIFEAANLWGAYASVDEWFEASEALQEDIKSLVTRETGGGQIVGFNYYSGNYFFTKKPLNTLADFKGVKTRSHSNVLSDLVNHMGADAQTMAFADVYPALERGVLDGAVTCGSCAVGQKWFEVTDYLTGPVPGTFAETFITFNAKIWNSLPEDFQAIILAEGLLHSDRAKAAALQADIEAEGQLIELGMEHSNFSPEMLALLKEGARLAVIPNWAKRAGGPESEAVKLYNSKVAPITGLYVASDGSVDEK